MPRGTMVGKYGFIYPDKEPIEAYFPANSVEEAQLIIDSLVLDDKPLKVYLGLDGSTLFNPVTLQPSLDMPITTNMFGFLTVYTVLETEHV